MEALPKPLRFGDYFLQAKIAQGGMADVFIATSVKEKFSHDFVAIKKLLPHLNSNKAFVDLLIHEAKVSVLLNHPNIAHVFDLGSYKSEFFIAMEYVHGKSLDRLIDKTRSKEGLKIHPEIATYIVLEVLRALSFAHHLKDAKGRDLDIVHRDLSPGNILLSYSGDVKLTDFGIATAAGRLQSGFTQSTLGKLVYMPPEQAVNDPVIRASDLYSLGVVYFEMLTGQLPFQAENQNQLLKKIIDGRTTDMSVIGHLIPSGLRDIIGVNLNKSTRKRFQSGPELYHAIVEFFKQDRQVDFSSKVTRDYFRKKLTELLRTSFESEIVKEIEIVQKTMQSVAPPEELIKTSPQTIPANLSEAFEATTVEADVSNEITRHFPLTQAERSRILAGLPPEKAIQSTGTHGFSSSTQESFADDIFAADTVFDGEISAESSALRRISAKDRLANSSLKRDQKEALSQQLPAVEIVTAADMESFERSTFGNAELANTATRALNRDSIFKDFEAIRQSESKLKSKQRNSDQQQRQSHPAARASAVSNKQNERVSSRSTHRTSKSGRLGVITALIALVSIGITAVYYGNDLFSWLASSFSSQALLPTERVHLRIVGEAQPDQQRQFKTLVIEKNIRYVTDFFNSEYTRYTGEVKAVLDLTASDPGVLISGLSQQTNASTILSSEALFDFLNISGFKRPAGSKILFIYLYPQNADGKISPSFPREYVGARSQPTGAVFSPADESQGEINAVFIARQIASIFGASDKRDPNSGLPINPEGLADPTLKPIYPQNKAELMAFEIALSPLEKKSPESLKDIVIGPKTAYELGWISKMKFNQLMP